MAYNSQGIIEATDYNNFVGNTNSTTTTHLNAIWGAGTGDMGYGQTIGDTAPVVAGADEVSATQWATMLNRINSMRQHQNAAAPYTAGDIPSTGDVIDTVASIQTNINSCYTDRHVFHTNGATTNGTSTAHTIALTTSIFSGTVASKVATFSSASAMRYFFNAGGQITFDIVSASNSDSDTRGIEVRDWLNTNLNAVTIRARTTAYSGTAYATWGTSRGRYDLASSGTSTIFKYEPGGTYGTTDSVKLDVVTNGDENGTTTLTFNLSVVVNLGSYTDANDTSTVTFNSRLISIEPPTTYLSKTWVTPSFT